jgi:hypothetical protein
VELTEEKQRRSARFNTCVIKPNNNKKKYFDMVVVMLLMYTAILVPIFTCFYDEVTDIHFAFDLIVDFLFMIDIILSFFSAYEVKPGIYEYRKSKIACNYIKGFFFIDLLTTLPF